MKNLRKWTAAALVLVLLLTVLPPSHRAAAEDEALAAAQELWSLGLFLGVGTDARGEPDFALDTVLTRSEAVTLLVRLLGKEEEAQGLPYAAPFDDLPDWARPYVNFAYRHGLTNGVSATEFCGWGTATASQFLTLVLRALGYRTDSDFSFDRPWELSDRLGVTSGEYNAHSRFTRGDAAIISRNALSVPVRGSSHTLLEFCLGEAGPDASGFEIHFIDVGEGDAALVLCEGHAMLVDGGPASASSLIYSYLKKLGIDRLDYIVCSHPHEDHVGGLAGALNYATADAALSPVRTYDSRPFNSFVKYLQRQGVDITVPAAGETYPLGSAEVLVLGPIGDAQSVNNTSIVLRIRYGGTSFLLTGDAELEEEQALLDSGLELESTLLKVGHHGSVTSTGETFLSQVRPAFAVISTGSDNLYGHPAELILRRLEQAVVTVYRTDLHGDIVCRSDGETLSFAVEHLPEPELMELIPSEPGEDDPSPRTSQTYILNTNTRRFHSPDCPSALKINGRNRQEFWGTREELLEMGYSPCGNCRP